MINEVEYFKIDPNILVLPDERIQKYKDGKWTQEQFLCSITAEDPFHIRDGWLALNNESEKYLTDKISNEEKEIEKLNPLKLWRTRKKLVEKYPELKPVVDKINEDFKLGGHPTIAKYRRVKPLAKQIIKLGIKL